MVYTGDLVQECSNSSALAMELPHSSAKVLIYLSHRVRNDP